MKKQIEPVTPELVTCREAARLAGVGLRQIHRGIAANEIIAFDVGGWCRVRWVGKGGVLQWIESKRRPARDRASERPQTRKRGQ